MELLLRIEDAIGESWLARAGSPATSARGSVDVCVSVDADHTVAHLTAALVAHVGSGSGSVAMARLHRPEPPSRAASRGAVQAGPLDPSTRIGELALRSGERLVLTAGGCPHSVVDRRSSATRLAPGPTLVVVSGPDVGRRCPVGAGITIGRDRSCDLVLTDPNVARCALRVEPRPAGGVASAPTADSAHRTADPSVIARPIGDTAVWINGASIDDGMIENVSVDDLLRVGSSTLRVLPAPAAPDQSPLGRSPEPHDDGDRSGQIRLHRLPDRAAPLRPVVFPPLGDVPERPEPPRFGLLVALAPVLLGVTLAVFYSPRMLIFAGFAPIMAGAAYLEARRRNGARFTTAMADFETRVAARAVEVDAAVRAERRQRFAHTPDLVALAGETDAQPPRIWSRVLGPHQGLVVRVGLGIVRSMVEVQPETRGDGEARALAASRLDGRRLHHDAPVAVDLAAAGVVALVGEPADVGELAASIVAQASCHHPPSELFIAASLHPSNPALRWIGWLPHVRARSSPLADPSVTVGKGGRALLSELLAVVERRLTGDAASTAGEPHLLLVIDGTAELDDELVRALLSAAAAAKVSVLWLIDRLDRVPWQTTVTVQCRPLLHDEASLLTSTEEPETEQSLEIDRLPTPAAERLARALAVYCDPADVSRSGRSPTIASLTETLGVERFDPGWVAARWQRAAPRSLEVPLGLTADGPLVVDLVAHGPHGLIGGTSGSGKSELLISLIASLLASYPPEKVNVLFVDYKGGASSEPFTDAPHTVGCVTNLDSFLARRALTSLGAELNRRMALLAGRAKDLAELAAQFPSVAPPALVIVVDELATLVRDVPEFVAGLVDIAQRGRSLGIHLLLATQRPAGVVNDQILANTNLRIALRMLDGSESSGLVGSPDAAAIPTGARGRALARLGAEPPVVFQSAWSSAPVSGGEAIDAIEIRPLLDRRCAEPEASSAAPDQPKTQLRELLRAVSSAAAAVYPTLTPHRPWCDELPAVVPLTDARIATDSLEPDRDLPTTRRTSEVVIGLVDDPERQAQEPAVVDLATGALAVFGIGGAGATTALRTVAVSSALDTERRSTPGLAIVGLDFGSGDLADIARLPQCVEVAPGDDLEAVTRLIALLDQTIQERRSRRRSRSLGGAQPHHEPTVLLLVDDYGNLAATFEGSTSAVTLHPWLEKLHRVITDGRQLGVHTALTATRRAAVKTSVLSAITNRIVLRQAEPAAFVEHGLPGSLHDTELVPGRGFSAAGIQIQIAVADRGSLLVASQPAEHGRPQALATMALPANVRLDSLTPISPIPGRSRRSPHSIVLGVADLAKPGDAVSLDLGGGLVVVGGPGSGRSTALHTIAHQLLTAGVDVWAIGETDSPVQHLPGLQRRAFGSPTEVANAIDDLAESVANSAGEGPRPVLVVDDVDLLDRPELDRSLGQLTTIGVRWVAATTSVTTFSSNPFVQQLRRTRPLLYLQPESGREVHELTGVATTIRPGLPMPPGRGVLVAGRRATVIQVAQV